MDARLRRNPPIVHFCGACDEYLNIPVDADEGERRIGECPYCRVMLWENSLGMISGRKGGDTAEAHD